jgi:hypothetical protein
MVDILAVLLGIFDIVRFFYMKESGDQPAGIAHLQIQHGPSRHRDRQHRFLLEGKEESLDVLPSRWRPA